ncbi:hypothetical protein ABIA33_007715, partial [Streptacidiphilus sp. MAP12-16]
EDGRTAGPHDPTTTQLQPGHQGKPFFRGK